MTANIIITAGSTLPNPPSGEATLFINTENNNILSLKMPDGSITVYSDEAAEECCSCELAKKFLHDIGCALKAGMLPPDTYQALVNSGFNVTSTSTDDGHGNKSCTVTMAPQNAVPTSVTISDPGPVSIGGGAISLSGAVLPVGANQALIWNSQTPAKGTVDPTTGLFTPIATGTTLVTAYSAVKPSVFATRTITVEP